MQASKFLGHVTAVSRYFDLKYSETTAVMNEKEIEADPNDSSMRISGERSPDI
jgi:hypothetical protein